MKIEKVLEVWSDAQIESMARKLCTIRGIDPEETIGVRRDSYEAPVLMKNWRKAKLEVVNHLELTLAITSVPGR